MVHSIDADGSFHLDSGVVLARGATRQQIVGAGVAVSCDLDMKTGWHLIAIGSSRIFGRSANISLLLYDNELRQIHFAVMEAGVTDPEDIRKLQDKLLIGEFGIPQVHDARKSMYIFPWGTLTSEYDPRGGQAQMVISWK